MRLNSIQVHSQPHPGLEICVLSPSRLQDSRLLFILVESHLNPGPYICISPTSRPTKLHLSTISNAYMFQDVCLTSIQVISQLENCIPVPYHPILVSRCASQLNPGPISNSSRSRDLCLLSTQAPRFTFLLCLSWILPQSGSWYLHLIYIQVTSHQHPGPPNCILVPPKHHLKPIQVSRCVFHLHPDPFSIGELYLSSILVPYHPIHVSRCASQLNPGHISTPSRSCRLNFSPFKVPSWCNSSTKICVSPSSKSCITCIQVQIFLCHLHPSTI